MTLRLRNTLTRKVEPVEPLEPGRVRMYSCGPTVYRYAHVGNLRSYLLADLIRRTLIYHGLAVFHVKNITDVGHLRDERFDRGEDRMLVAAGLESKSPAEIAAAYETAFHTDEAAMNILPAHVFPRATEHIDDMLEMVEALVDAGAAYVSHHGNVYFSVGTFRDYGRLSGNDLAALRAGHRGAVESDKLDPADFALWKHAESGRLLRWPTRRWGEGFPGWHIECSTMSGRYLGPEFDVHTGGIDNVFPHHEDEIAQSASLTGKTPARHWVHGEFLLMSGRKMAKSAGNFQRITELADSGVSPLAFRYLALTSRYGRKLNYSDRSLNAAAAALASLTSRLRGLGPPPGGGPWRAPQALRPGTAGDRPLGVASGPAGHGDPNPSFDLRDRAHDPDAPLSPAGRDLHEGIIAALDDDLDTPTALAIVRDALRAKIPADERRWLALDADLVFGLDLDRVWTVPAIESEGLEPAQLKLLDERSKARANGDYARADGLRGQLLEQGVEVIDHAGGESTWRKVARQS
jgi:cysteinyl-tRNA synthetase